MKDPHRLAWLMMAGLVACAQPDPTPANANQGAPVARESPDVSLVSHDRETTPQTTADVPPPPAKTAEPAVKKPDVIYVPTPQPIVDRMLKMAQVKKSDLVYDLGSGDGRIVITAAKKYGARGVGFDIDPDRIAEARANAEKEGVTELVTFEQKDIFTLDLTPANVITLYLLPDLNVRLIPQLEKMKPGSRIVSHNYDMKGVKHLQAVTLKPAGEEEDHYAYLWHIPLKHEKAAAEPAK